MPPASRAAHRRRLTLLVLATAPASVLLAAPASAAGSAEPSATASPSAQAAPLKVTATADTCGLTLRATGLGGGAHSVTVSVEVAATGATVGIAAPDGTEHEPRAVRTLPADGVLRLALDAAAVPDREPAVEVTVALDGAAQPVVELTLPDCAPAPSPSPSAGTPDASPTPAGGSPSPSTGSTSPGTGSPSPGTPGTGTPGTDPTPSPGTRSPSPSTEAPTPSSTPAAGAGPTTSPGSGAGTSSPSPSTGPVQSSPLPSSGPVVASPVVTGPVVASPVVTRPVVASPVVSSPGPSASARPSGSPRPTGSPSPSAARATSSARTGAGTTVLPSAVPLAPTRAAAASASASFTAPTVGGYGATGFLALSAFATPPQLTAAAPPEGVPEPLIAEPLDEADPSQREVSSAGASDDELPPELPTLARPTDIASSTAPDTLVQLAPAAFVLAASLGGWVLAGRRRPEAEPSTGSPAVTPPA